MGLKIMHVTFSFFYYLALEDLSHFDYENFLERH